MTHKRPRQQMVTEEIVETDGKRVERKKYKIMDDSDDEGDDDGAPLDGGLDDDDGTSKPSKGLAAFGDSAELEVELPYADIVREQVQPEVFCFGCKVNFGKSRELGIDKGMDKLHEAYHTHKAIMEKEELALKLAQVYEKEIFKPGKAEGKEMMEWPASTILLHLNEHITDMLHVVEETAHELHRMGKAIRDSVYTKTPSGKKKVNVENKKAWLECIRMKMAVVDRWRAMTTR
jgi:hypothetical protein